jgi:tetratricopeptide (TPR) repeat protein
MKKFLLFLLSLFLFLVPVYLLKEGLFLTTPAQSSSLKKLDLSNPALVKLNEAGLRYFQEKQFDMAKTEFEAALKLAPDQPVILNNLSRACFELGQAKGEEHLFSEALSLFQEAIQFNPDVSAFHVASGWAYDKLDQDDHAIDELESAIRLDPKEGNAYQILGEIYHKQDAPERAIETLEKALSLQPDNDSLRKRIAKMKQDNNLESHFGKTASSHFIIKFEGEENKEIANIVSDNLDEAFHEIGGLFYEKSLQPVIVILYSDQSFRDNVHSPVWAGGIYDGKIRIPVRGWNQDLGGLKRLLFHEYTHAVLYQITSYPIPTWLNEGLAIYFEGGGTSNRLGLRVEAARKNGNLIPLHQLQGSFMEMDSATSELAYGESKEAVQFLIDRYSIKRLRDLLDQYKGMNTFPTIFEQEFLIPFDQFETEFLRGTR